MSIINVLLYVMLLFSGLCEIYIIFSVFIKKREYKKNEIKKIPNTRYIALILVVIVQFVVYGILRNFR